MFRIVPVGIPTNGAYEHIVKEALKNGQSDASSTSVEPSEHWYVVRFEATNLPCI